MCSSQAAFATKPFDDFLGIFHYHLKMTATDLLAYVCHVSEAFQRSDAGFASKICMSKSPGK